MALTINGTSPKVCTFNGNDVKKIVVKYGEGSVKYAGLGISVSYTMSKKSTMLFPFIPASEYHCDDAYDNKFRFYSILPEGEDCHIISKFKATGRIYVDTGNGTVFLDRSDFTGAQMIDSDMYIRSTGNYRTIYNTEGYISIVTRMNFNYTITYDDGNTVTGSYNSAIYDEYGVNADSTHWFGGNRIILPATNGGLEKVVWTKP